MRRTLLIGIAILMVSCGKVDWRDATAPAAERAKALLKEMTLEEKVGQMCQYVAPCYVPPGQGSPYKNIDATDENLGNKNLADKIRRGEVGSFLHCMTTKEAIALQELAKESRLGIPLLIGIDAIHGNALIEGCTIYPTSINLASTFDPALAERIGAETALEMRQKGLYWTFAPNLDVARDARWGRMGETFGEDPFLVSEMGKYSIWGLQGRDRNFDEGHVIACAKHLIAGGEPFGGLNAAPMDLSERQLREIYLPPFVAAVQDAHVGTVMAAHNEVNGIPCHGNSWLLKDLLRNELGFDGFVVSDWMDIERLHAMHHWAPDSTEAFVRSVEAGIDMHMQGDNYFEAVIGAVKSGRIPMKRIDEAVGKILEMKFAVGLFEAPLPSLAPLENAEAHRQTALDAARESIVLLKNNGVLPLTASGLASPDRSHPRLVRGRGPLASRVGGAERSEESGLPEPDAVRRLFVVGPNADSQTILGDWAAPQPDSLVVTVLEGLRNEFPGAMIDTMCFGGMIANIDAKGIEVAKRKAAAADVCIVVAGENSQRYSAFGRTCGENCDRDDLDLPGMQQELLEAVASTGRPTVLVLMTGRANSLAWAKENVDAILNVWEPGQMGGQAVAEVLSGKVNPSGKLPVTMPRSVGQVPTVYNHKHSQYSRLFATNETGPLWPFGFGLSYSHFSYSSPFINSGQPSGPGRVHPRSAAAEYGLSPEAAPERSEASKAGLASPDRGRPRHARGRGPDRRRGGENQFSQTLREMGGAERSEESGLPEPALDAIATVSITVSNEGPYDGTEVVQLYVRDEYASVTRPVKELKAFKRVSLKAGESAEVTFAITPEMLQCYGADNRWSVEPGEFTILVGSSSDDKDLQAVTLNVK